MVAAVGAPLRPHLRRAAELAHRDHQHVVQQAALPQVADQRGLLNDVLVLAMGEFGRTPQMGTQGSTDGRNHWPVCMSMAVAGGGFRHGQVIGATEKDGGSIKERPVTPGEIAATIYHHMGVPRDATYPDPTGRPRHILDSGEPIAELL